jgi:hypothetical protein
MAKNYSPVTKNTQHSRRITKIADFLFFGTLGTPYSRTQGTLGTLDTQDTLGTQGIPRKQKLPLQYSKLQFSLISLAKY